VTAGAAAKLAISTQPVGGVSGALLGTQPVVEIQDSAGNRTTSTATIIVTSTGTIGGTEAAGLAAVGGVATFTNLTLAGTISTNYTLTFSSGALTPITSANVQVT